MSKSMAVFACLSFIGLGVVMSLSRKARLEAAAAQSHEGLLHKTVRAVSSSTKEVVNDIAKDIDRVGRKADRTIEDAKDDLRSVSSQERSAERTAEDVADDVSDQVDKAKRRFWNW